MMVVVIVISILVCASASVSYLGRMKLPETLSESKKRRCGLPVAPIDYVQLLAACFADVHSWEKRTHLVVQTKDTKIE